MCLPLKMRSIPLLASANFQQDCLEICRENCDVFAVIHRVSIHPVAEGNFVLM